MPEDKSGRAHSILLPLTPASNAPSITSLVLYEHNEVQLNNLCIITKQRAIDIAQHLSRISNLWVVVKSPTVFRVIPHDRADTMV